MSIKNWIIAFRLRTLPLAAACIGMGNFLAASKGVFNWQILVFSILTTLLLQILSNLANDYGDSVNGADNIFRKGPQRAVQSGAISRESMKVALLICGVLTFISGIYLLYISLSLSSINAFGLFLVLGLLAIVAAIKYTAGNNPYGYAGFGDLAVLVFFGWVGVCGSFFLQVKNIYPEIFLPATSCGLFSMAVLNINNMRDIDSDKRAGKYSIPVRIGIDKAKVYHMLLLLMGCLCTVLYVLLNYRSIVQWSFLITFPLIIRNGLMIWKTPTPEGLDVYLKPMAMNTLLFVLIFGLGLLLL